MEIERYSVGSPLIGCPLFSQTVAEIAPALNFFSGRFPSLELFSTTLVVAVFGIASAIWFLYIFDTSLVFPFCFNRQQLSLFFAASRGCHQVKENRGFLTMSFPIEVYNDWLYHQ